MDEELRNTFELDLFNKVLGKRSYGLSELETDSSSDSEQERKRANFGA